MHQILKITLLTIKNITIMKAKNYYELQLNVNFTMNELMTIARALFDSWENDKMHDWNKAAEEKVKIRKKLQNQIDFYEEIIK